MRAVKNQVITLSIIVSNNSLCTGQSPHLDQHILADYKFNVCRDCRIKHKVCVFSLAILNLIFIEGDI